MYGRSGQNMYNRQNDDRAGLFGVPPRQVRPREPRGPRRITARYTLRALPPRSAHSIPARLVTWFAPFGPTSIAPPGSALPCVHVMYIRDRRRPLAPSVRRHGCVRSELTFLVFIIPLSALFSPPILSLSTHHTTDRVTHRGAGAGVGAGEGATRITTQSRRGICSCRITTDKQTCWQRRSPRSRGYVEEGDGWWVGGRARRKDGGT